ncbi:MAG TPA: ABC transporter ATP-binding protein [Rhodopila sp.]|jgi:oligopeptide/dipeptide ABC transporter ATP-binding protein|nr:ABC transporter ATP-binding protein [Rhodopila sp.]
MSLLEIEDLVVHFDTDAGPVQAVDGVGLNVEAGEIIGLVGESGSGKSVTGLAILGLIRPPGRIVRGAVRFEGNDIVGMTEAQRRGYRGRRIALVPQSPRTSLNPVITVGEQIARLSRLHGGASRGDAMKRAISLMEQVGIPDAGAKARQYPHQLSGGTCQRIMVAMALTSEPRLLIADEPTTGLDVSIAARILDLLRDVCVRTGSSIILITHDLGVVAETCDRVAVMHGGQLVEAAAVRDLFRHPSHPYTRALVASIPRIDADIELMPIPGAVPSLLRPPPGCRYAGRCDLVMGRCRIARPPLVTIGAGHMAACFATGAP